MVTLNGTTLTIPAGDTHRNNSISATATNNSLDEPDQQVKFTGTGESAAAFKDPAPVYLTILDDDTQPGTANPRLYVYPGTISENGGTARERAAYVIAIDNSNQNPDRQFKVNATVSGRTVKVGLATLAVTDDDGDAGASAMWASGRAFPIAGRPSLATDVAVAGLTIPSRRSPAT